MNREHKQENYKSPKRQNLAIPNPHKATARNFMRQEKRSYPSVKFLPVFPPARFRRNLVAASVGARTNAARQTTRPMKAANCLFRFKNVTHTND